MAGINPAQLEDIVTKLSDADLANSLRDPAAQIPAFMALSEIKRRQQLRNAASSQQATPAPTVREGVVGFSGGGWLGAMGDFEKFNIGKIGQSIADNPERLFLGAMDPFGRKLWGTALNKDYDHALNAYGGPADETYAQAEAEGISTGPSEASHRVAQVIASYFAGDALSGAASAGGSAAQAAGSTAGATGATGAAGVTAAEGAAQAAQAAQAAEVAQAAQAAEAAQAAQAAQAATGAADATSAAGGIGGMPAETAAYTAGETGATGATSASGFGGVGTDPSVGASGITYGDKAEMLGRQAAGGLGSSKKAAVMSAQYGGMGSGDRYPTTDKKRKKYSANKGEEYTEYEYDPEEWDPLTDTSEAQYYRPVTRKFAAGGAVISPEQEAAIREYLRTRGKLPARGGIAQAAPTMTAMGDAPMDYGTTGGLLGLSTPAYEDDVWVDKEKRKGPGLPPQPGQDPNPVLTPMPQLMPGGSASGGARVSGPAFQPMPLPQVLTREEALARLPQVPKTQFTGIDQSSARADALRGQYGQDFSKAEAAQAKRRERLETRGGDDKNMAMLRAGLGIMGGTSGNAFENIAKGAMSGVDYYTQAKEAQRREEDAIAQGDMQLAAAMHGDKLQLLQLAMGEAKGQDTAANAEGSLGYQRGITAAGMVGESERDRRSVERDNANMRNQSALAQWQAARQAATAGARGDELRVDNAMAQKVFAQLVARDEQRIGELAAKESKGPLTLNERRELASLRSPNRMRDVTQQAYDAIGSPGGAYFKRSGREYDGGLGGMGVVDATTRR